MLVRARLEQGIPKLLVKVNPNDAASFNGKNLGEVILKKPGGQKGHVAVLHLCGTVARGDTLLSLKLAELLDVAEGEQVEVSHPERSSKSSDASPKPRRRASAITSQAPPFEATGRRASASVAAPPHNPVTPSSSSTRPSPDLGAHRFSPQPREGLHVNEQRRSVQSDQQQQPRPQAHNRQDPPTLDQHRIRQDPLHQQQTHQSAHFYSQNPQQDRPQQQPQLRHPTLSQQDHQNQQQPFLRQFSPQDHQNHQQTFLHQFSPQDMPTQPNTNSLPSRPTDHQVQQNQRPQHFSGVTPTTGDPSQAKSQPRPVHTVVPPSEATSLLRPQPTLIPHSEATPAVGKAELADELPPELGCSPREASTRSQLGTQLPSKMTAAAADTLSPRERSQAKVGSNDRPTPLASRSVNERKASLLSPMALVPMGLHGKDPRASSSKARRSVSMRRRSTNTLTLGALQRQELDLKTPELHRPMPANWRRPLDTGSGLERSELGTEITLEVQQWLNGMISGLQCSQVVMDKALTVLSNFKLSSGCELEVLGGPLGAIIGGYSEADWLYDEIFNKEPAAAVTEAFEVMGFKSRGDGDWSGYVVEEVSLAYRRQCLRGHPSRGGSARAYLKLQVAMELVRAFCIEREGEPAGAVFASSSSRPCQELDHSGTFVLDDQALVRELRISAKEAEEEADNLSAQRLEELNRSVDEYILRQMCFKSDIVHEIARLHENSAYSILGVSSDATDAEIKKAYRIVAMQCHPDKGGDKEEFQELHEAYEKIMEQRRGSVGPASKSKMPEEKDSADPDGPAAEKAEKEKTSGGNAPESEAEQETKNESRAGEGGDDEKDGEDSSDKSLLEKTAKAAEEASCYAKTAAEFSHQAAEAAETARQGRDQGSHDSLTKSIAHSAIVLTLTVVKAVRVVGYATMDVAAQCRLAARKYPDAQACADASSEAMSLGLEALNAALACAEVTETTAAELQAPATVDGEASSVSDRFISAAVRASLAAANASNAAMSAAIAAVEGNRQCMQALRAKAAQKDAEATKAAKEEGGDADKDKETQDQAKGPDEDEESDQEEDAEASSPTRTAKKPTLTHEEAAAAALKRQVAQRQNNHKVLHRLNAEILAHQQNVRQFLQANRQLIPKVSCEAKSKVHTLLRDYAREVASDMKRLPKSVGVTSAKALLSRLQSASLLVPFLQPLALAIPVSVKARILKMAALYDLPLATKTLAADLFEPARRMVSEAGGATEDGRQVDDTFQRVLKALSSDLDQDDEEQCSAVATPNGADK
eukprot:TRINITY_DN72616_c0_g1_i1.p1 TRINITY_DN72616_c0_g1~~TRINITY_DN72616_c0_g1_i1.p1  ORF type:complete len:1274 (-),score=294.67 TRINITY_DN72616_c0_g1_i1:108-3929(-)